MNKYFFAFFLLISLHMSGISQSFVSPAKFTLVIHGGAGTIDKNTLTPEQELDYNKALNAALLAGYEILKNGGTSLDAVECAVMSMEDCPLFNAGKGSVFTHEGKIEMDAAIMSGLGTAGAVACVEGIKNPIHAARTVMEKSPHVLLCGKGAEKFAKEQGLTFEDSSYFATDFRFQQLQKAIELDKIELDHQTRPRPYRPSSQGRPRMGYP
jgi:beta-aspartyl-peptidase (threonine type)